MSEKVTKYLTPIVALFFATALSVTASSTIGTSISTGGNLTVTGTTTTTGLYASTTATGSDITLKAMDDIIITPIDQVTIDIPGDGFVGISGNALDVSVESPLSDVGTLLLQGSGFEVSVANSATEFGVYDGWAYITDLFYIDSIVLTPTATPPIACAGSEGGVYFDSDLHKPCYCNGTNWVLFSDDSTMCS